MPADVGRFIDVLSGLMHPRGKTALASLVSASAAALNALGGHLHTLASSRASRSQRTSIDSLALRWSKLARHMVGNGEALHYDVSAFGRMVDKGSGGTSVRLKASMVDSLGV